MGSVASVIAAPHNYSLAAAGGSMSVASALQALRLHTARSVDIVDTVDHIQKNLDALIKAGAGVHSISASDGASLTVTAAQFTAGSTLLSRWAANSGNTVTLAGTTAAGAVSVAGNASLSWVSNIQVSDTSQNIQKNIDALAALSGSTGRVSMITQTGATAPMTLTATQFTNDGDALARIRNGSYSLAITGATVSQTLNYAGNAHVRTVAIRDGTAAVASKLDQLQALGLKVKSIATTDTTALDVQAGQVRSDALVLGKVVTGYQLHVLNAAANQLSGLASNSKVLSVGLVDTAANLASNWKLLNRLESSLDTVEVSDNTNPVSISADQFATGGAVLAKFDLAPTDYQLAITGASAGGASELAAQSSKITQIDVADTGANVGANLADLQGLVDAGTLHGITLSRGASQIALTGDDLGNYGGVLSMINGGNYGLAVSGLSAASAQTLLSANANVASVSVSDTAADIGDRFGALLAMGKRLTGIVQTDGGQSIALGMNDYAHGAGVLAQIQGGYAVAVNGVSAAKVATVAADSHVSAIAVADTASGLASHWSQLLDAQPLIQSVSQTDSTALALSATRYQSAASVGLLAKLDSTIPLSVSGATVAQASSIASDAAVSRIDVTDLASNVAAHLSDLASLQAGGKLTSITQQGTPAPFSVAAGDLGGLTDTLALIKGGNYSLAVTNVGAANAQSLVNGNAHVSSVAVADDGSAIAANLGALNALGAKLTRIDQSDSGTPLALTPALLGNDTAALNRITGGYTATISGANASNAVSLGANPHVVSLTLSDSGAQISSHWNALSDLGSKLSGQAITQTDTHALTLTADQVDSGASLLGQLSTAYTLDVSQASASQAASLAAGDQASNIDSIQVADTASAVGAQFDALALNGLVKAVTIGGDTPAVPLHLTAAQYAGQPGLIGMINGGHYPLAISGASASDAGGLAANTDVQSLTVSDSSAAISAQFANLASMSKLQRVSLTDPGGTIGVSEDTLLANGSLLDKVGSAYALSISGATLANLDQDSATPNVSSIAIADTSANVSAGFDSLVDLGSTVSQITLADTTAPLALTESQWQAGSGVLASIDGSYSVALSDVQAADAASVASDASVTSISVNDTADNIASAWDSLVSMYSATPAQLQGITISDNNPLVLTADQQTAGADLLNALLPDATIQTA